VGTDVVLTYDGCHCTLEHHLGRTALAPNLVCNIFVQLCATAGKSLGAKRYAVLLEIRSFTLADDPIRKCVVCSVTLAAACGWSSPSLTVDPFGFSPTPLTSSCKDQEDVASRCLHPAGLKESFHVSILNEGTGNSCHGHHHKFNISVCTMRASVASLQCV